MGRCAQLCQTSKTRQKLDWKIREIDGNNCALNVLTSFEYEVHGMTGNRSFLNMQKLAWTNSWNHFKLTYFWRVLAIWNQIDGHEHFFANSTRLYKEIFEFRMIQIFLVNFFVYLKCVFNIQSPGNFRWLHQGLSLFKPESRSEFLNNSDRIPWSCIFAARKSWNLKSGFLESTFGTFQ